MTGSGKTAAFVLPDPAPPAGASRGGRRAPSSSPPPASSRRRSRPTSPRSASTPPVTGAAIFGGVGMGPQEHALRRGVDVIVATPGRLLDHMQRPTRALKCSRSSSSTRPTACSTSASCPTSAACCKARAAPRQTLMFCATMPKEIVGLSREILHNPVTLEVGRKSAPAVGDHPGHVPGAPRAQVGAPGRADEARRIVEDAIVFTRTKHRANRVADFLERQGISAAKHPRQPQPGPAHRGAGRLKQRDAQGARRHRHRGARHRRGGAGARRQLRRARRSPTTTCTASAAPPRAGQTGDAFTFVAPEEEQELRASSA